MLFFNPSTICRVVIIFITLVPGLSAAFPAVSSWDYFLAYGPCVDIGFTLSSASSFDFIGTRSETTTPDNSAGVVNPDSGASSTTKRVHICFFTASTTNYVFINEDQDSDGEIETGEFFECSGSGSLVGDLNCGGAGQPPTWDVPAISVSDPIAPTLDVDLSQPSPTVTYTATSAADQNTDWDTLQAHGSPEVCKVILYPGRVERSGSTPNWYVDDTVCSDLILSCGVGSTYLAQHGWTPFYEPKTCTLVASGSDLSWALGSDGFAALAINGDVNVWIEPNVGVDFPLPSETSQYTATVTALNTGDTDYPMTVSATVSTVAEDIFWNADFVDSSGDPIGLNGRHNMGYGSATTYEFGPLNPSLLNGTFNSGVLWTIPGYLPTNCTGTATKTCDIHDANGLVTDAYLTPNYMLGASYDGAGVLTLPSANPRLNSGGGGLVDNAFMTARSVRVANSTDIDGRYNINSRAGTDNVELSITAAGTLDADVDVYADFEYVIQDTDKNYHVCFVEEVDANTVTFTGCDLTGVTPSILAGHFGPRPVAVVRVYNNTDTKFVWDNGYLGGKWPWILFNQLSMARILGGRVSGVWSGAKNETVGSWIPHDTLGATADKMGACCRDNANTEFSQSKLLWNIGNNRKVSFTNLHLINPFGISMGATSANEVNEDLEISYSLFYNDPTILAQNAVSAYRSQFVELKSIERLSAVGNYFYGAFPDITGNCSIYHFLLNDEGTYNLGSDVNIYGNYIDDGGCIAMFAVFGGGNSDNKTIFTFPRVKVAHNIANLDFYDVPDWSDIGPVQPTGGLIFPKMTLESAQIERNTNQITWARDASALFVHGGWFQNGTFDDNILQVGDTFSFSQNGGPACTGTESTFS